jgi:lantibiotic modifying enzyme
MAAWCHGAPGIGLARACGSRNLADEHVPGEIGAAMRATLAAPRSRLDHLCCGNLARAEALLSVGQVLAVPELASRGRELAEGVAAQVVEYGRAGMRGQLFERGAAVPGFFQGLSGIGYQLLRSWAPDRLPSVLAFEAPAGRSG